MRGKVAIVTGASRGIGKAIALGLAREGAKVIVAARSVEAPSEKLPGSIHETVEQIEKIGGKAVAVRCDVTDEASVRDLVDTVLKEYGRLDVLVNAMGMNIKRDAFEYPMEEWDRLFAVNVKGTMTACKWGGRAMKAQASGGAIVNLSSVRGIRGYAGGNAGYCSTKGAVELMTKALAIEWAPHHIRVNALGPALVITPGTKHIAENPELAKKYAAAVPLGRIAMPEDLVGAVLYLVSDAASFVTGQTIYVDGGLTAS